MIELYLEEDCNLIIKDWEAGVEITAIDNQEQSHKIKDLLLTKDDCIELSLFFKKMANDRKQ